jgi:GTP-binding protein
MAFVDEVTIFAKAGDGGDGVVRFRHEKYIDKGGPSGGDGGNGGDVYALAVRDVHLLAKYKTQKKFEAGRGSNGGKKSLEGENGEDIDIKLPIGSIITNKETGEIYRLNEDGERVLLLKGGRGGYGNEHFKSSTNVTPKEFTPGKKVEGAEFFIEVELIADIGFIGLPSAGKTSLLNSLTRAHGKVGDYPFTTLEPNLGECFGYIISDIPGLIEGAAEGKGLGHRFLRHIKRTKMLVHLVSVENEDPLEAYFTIKKELETYDKEFSEKKEIIVLTKIDLVDEKKIEEIKKSMTSLGAEIETVTTLDENSLKVFREKMLKAVE